MAKYILPLVLYAHHLSSCLCLLAGPALLAAGGYADSWPMVAAGATMLLYGRVLGSSISGMLSANTQTDTLVSKMEHLLYTASALRDKGRGAN